MVGLPWIQPSFENPVEYVSVNVEGTAKVMELARTLNAKLIYSSSSSINNGEYKTPYTFSKWAGEEVVKTVGSFLVVELMRQGKSPQEACEIAVKRIVSSNSQENKFQVAYIAMNKNGDVGSYSIEPGFTYMDYFKGENKEKITESAL